MKATSFSYDPDVAKIFRGLALVVVNVEEIPEPHAPAERGW